MIKIDELNIYEITYKRYQSMVNSRVRNVPVEKSLFLVKHNDYYISLDNENNRFLIEEFKTRKRAICWLIRNDFSADAINSIKSSDLYYLLRNQNFRVVKV